MFKSKKYAWVVNSIAPAGKHMSDLLPFEFGIVNYDTGLTINPGEVGNCGYQFVIGSPNGKQRTDGNKVNRFYNAANHDMAFHTEKYKRAKEVDDIRVIPLKKEKSLNEYYLGFNGIDTCNSLTFECGKNYQFAINLTGNEVINLMGRHFTEVISIDTACCSPCGTGNCPTTLDGNTYADMLVQEFNNSLWASRFFTAHKIVKCTPDLPVPNKTFCNDFCITLCNNGTELDLSALQNQYPTLKVSQKSRKDAMTTYVVTKIGDVTVPAPYSTTSTVLEDCGTCPVGMTAQPKGFAYIIEVDNTQADVTPAAQLAAAQAAFPTVTFASKSSFSKGTSTYYVISSAPLATPTNDSKIVATLGETKAKCVGGPVTTTWSACGQKYRVTRDLCLTVKNDNCTPVADELVELAAAMASVADVVPGSVVLDPNSNDCITRYKVSQYSNCLEDGCDTYGTDGAKFADLPAFKNQGWDVCPCEGWTVNANGCPVPPAPVDRCCSVGVKFVMNRFADDEVGCILDLNQFRTPNDLGLTVSMLTPDPTTCVNPVPTWYQSSFADMSASHGIDVLKEVIAYRMASEGERFLSLMNKMGHDFMAAEGTKYGVDLKAQYNTVIISANRENRANYNSAHHDLRSDITLYVHEGNPALFEQIQGMLASGFGDACFSRFC